MSTYSVSEAKKKNSIISEEDFNTEYQESINNPESFWQKKAEETLDWFSNCLLYTSPSPRDRG